MRKGIIIFLLISAVLIEVVVLMSVSTIYFMQWNIHGYSRYINVDTENTDKLTCEGNVEDKDIYSYDVTLYKIAFTSKEESFCDYLKHRWINKKYLLQSFKNETNNDEYIKYSDDYNLCAYETDKYIIFTTKDNSFNECNRIIQLDLDKDKLK